MQCSLRLIQLAAQGSLYDGPWGRGAGNRRGKAAASLDVLVGIRVEFDQLAMQWREALSIAAAYCVGEVRRRNQQDALPRAPPPPPDGCRQPCSKAIHCCATAQPAHAHWGDCQSALAPRRCVVLLQLLQEGQLVLNGVLQAAQGGWHVSGGAHSRWG